MLNVLDVGLNGRTNMAYKPYTVEEVNKAEGNNGFKVFSTFACGGGSSTGYKLAGYEVVGINEIDEGLVKVYKANYHPKYIFNCDIRDLVTSEIPQSLYGIDVLDGSPPCSVFSMAGSREKAWGKEKTFREGQKKQRLDDLFFAFLDLAKKIEPKVIIAENVKGMLAGKAKGYVKEIVTELSSMGYTTQIFLLNASTMGVPQKRERVFFIAHKNEYHLPKLILNPNEAFITYNQIKTNEGLTRELTPGVTELVEQRGPHDRSVGDTNLRINGKNTYFTTIYIRDDEVPNTLASGSVLVSMSTGKQLTSRELTRIQSFPEDYNFVKNESYNHIKYILGMSVPPRMMEYVAKEVEKQWLSKI